MVCKLSGTTVVSIKGTPLDAAVNVELVYSRSPAPWVQLQRACLPVLAVNTGRLWVPPSSLALLKAGGLGAPSPVSVCRDRTR